MQRYTIDPAQFTADQWHAMTFECSTFAPASCEFHASARPFKRPRKHIALVVGILAQKSEEMREWPNEDEEAADDLLEASNILAALIPGKRWTRREARERLYDLLTSDIYTEAPEYAARVAEISDLLPVVFREGA